MTIEQRAHLINTLSYSDLASMLYEKGEQDGYPNITDKSKWREPSMAEKLGHEAHKKISAGKNNEKYGSDAYDKKNKTYSEYKTSSIRDKELNNLFERPYRNRTYAPHTVIGIYNGAYTKSAIEHCKKVDHYFGVFYKEKPVLIIKVDKEHVVSSLENGLKKMTGKKTTNLNRVEVSLKDTHLYEVAYKDEAWWKANK